MISVDEARAIVRGCSVALTETEAIPLSEATNRRLAGEILADRDDPPFDRAMMDGLAVRGADLTDLPARLELVGTVAAGDETLPSIGAGQAVRIFTGAPVPTGADSVVPVEQTDGEGEVRGFRQVGQDILRRGFFACAGDTVASGRLTPEGIAVCASFGADPVEVLRRPRVAVLSTGTELAAAPGAHEIRNSNGPMLTSLLADHEVIDLGAIVDDKDALLAAIRRGLEADVLVSTGAVSMGHKDFVPELLVQAGVEILFHKIALQPGKPVLFGRHENGHVFGLPGNPVSALVCADLFVLPHLAALSGATFESALIETQAPLLAPVASSPKRRRVFPCYLGADGVEPLPWRGSADMHTALRGNAYVAIEQGDDRAAGDPVTCFVPTRHATVVG